MNFNDAITCSPLTNEQRNTESAIVVFELKDKDFLRSRFMAEAFLPFSEIAKTGSDQRIESLEQIHLKLSRPTRKSKFSLLFILFDHNHRLLLFQFASSSIFLFPASRVSGTDVIQALEHRKGDNQATEFLSKLSSKAERK